MGQTNFEFLIDFDAEAGAKSMQQQLNKLSAEHSGELAPMMQALLKADYVGEEEIHIEAIQRVKGSVYLFGYGGRSTQPPFEVAEAFHELGCLRAYVRVYYDEGEQSRYFIGKKRVSLATFTTARRGYEDKEALEKLFLPKNRTQVEATLKEYEWDSNAYGDFCMMRFESKEGHSFYYRGNSEKMLLLTDDEYSPKVIFTAAFETAYLDPDSPPVSLAKRPTKISVTKLSVRKSGLSVLRGDNKKFAALKIGLVVHKYFGEYDGDCNAFLKTLTRNNFLGESFTKLLKYSANSKANRFLSSGLFVETSSSPVRLEVEIKNPDTPIDFSDMVKYLKSLDVKPFECEDREINFSIDWATSNAYVQCAVSKHRIKLKLAQLIYKRRDSKISVKEILKSFNHNPGLANKADWSDLYQRAREEAEAGDVDSMTVLANLLEYGRGWESNHEEAKMWRDKAGEGDDADALLDAGFRLRGVPEWRDPTSDRVNKAMDYFRRAAKMGKERAWDEISLILKRCPEMLESITLDPPADTKFDCSAWQTNDKEWMRKRRASWKELEPALKPEYKVKELTKLKKYYLTGELPVLESRVGDTSPMFKVSLFDLLWLHASEGYDELMALRKQVIAQRQFSRSVFSSWQQKFQRRLVNKPLTYQENSERPPLVIQNAPMYFRIFNNNYTEHGFRRHGEFVQLPFPRDHLRGWMDLANWFWLPKLHKANLAFALLDPDALEWWYGLMPSDIDFSDTREAWILPYIFLTFYRLHRFAKRGIDCPVREEFSVRLQTLLNERPFCDEIGRLWAYVRDNDFTLKDPWMESYDSEREWKHHKDMY